MVDLTYPPIGDIIYTKKTEVLDVTGFAESDALNCNGYNYGGESERPLLYAIRNSDNLPDCTDSNDSTINQFRMVSDIGGETTNLILLVEDVDFEVYYIEYGEYYFYTPDGLTGTWDFGDGTTEYTSDVSVYHDYDFSNYVVGDTLTVSFTSESGLYYEGVLAITYIQL